MTFFYNVSLWWDEALNWNSNNQGSKQHYTVTEQVTVVLAKCTRKKHTNPALETNCKV